MPLYIARIIRSPASDSAADVAYPFRIIETSNREGNKVGRLLDEMFAREIDAIAFVDRVSASPARIRSFYTMEICPKCKIRYVAEDGKCFCDNGPIWLP